MIVLTPLGGTKTMGYSGQKSDTKKRSTHGRAEAGAPQRDVPKHLIDYDSHHHMTEIMRSSPLSITFNHHIFQTI